MKNAFYSHGLEAVLSKHGRPEYVVRPVHPDGNGYAAITYPIDKELACLFAAAPELYEALNEAWDLLPPRPPHDPVHCQYAKIRAALDKARGES